MGAVSTWVTQLTLLTLGLLIQFSASCPPTCVCQNSTETLNTTSVVCGLGNLTRMPRDLPLDTTQLDLSGNNISSVREVTSLLLLEDLDISFNSLQCLNTSVFDGLDNLRTLDLSQNEISTIQPKVFANLSSLLEVNLAKNNLTQIYNETFLDVISLEKLYLYRNKISVVDNGSFASLDELVVLDLSYNALTELQQEYFTGLKSLTELKLQHNDISHIGADTFRSLVSLRHLDLSHNVLGQLDKFTFSWMPLLTSLSLADNNISQVETGFMGTSSMLEQLDMDRNQITSVNIPIFLSLNKLKKLSLSRMPTLTKLAFNAFHGLPSLRNLDLSHNPHLRIAHPHLFQKLPELISIDLSYNNLSTLSQLTFHSNLKLKTANLDGNKLVCSCGLSWLADQINQNSTAFSKDLQCLSEHTQQPVSLYGSTNMNAMCGDIRQVNTSDVVYFAIGSSAHLKCEFDADPHTIVIWTCPRGMTLTYHAFHPEVTSHMLTDADLNRNSSFHTTHYWHNSSSYYSNLLNYPDRVILLEDGSLYIDYVLRTDGGPYTCFVMNANDNSSSQILFKMDYGVFFQIKLMSILVGLGAALSVFLLNLVFSIIATIARRLVTKRRRVLIRNMLENMDTYKTTQFTRLRENYSVQLSRIRDHYHNQFHRLSDNYHSQTKRVRRGCSHQVERIRDNYTVQVGRLRNYSSHQIEQIREVYNNQLLKIRDYSSLQMIRMHEKYKLQQKHVIKLLETMNIDNCRTVMETECLRTESMIFDVDILKDAESSPLSPVSGSDSEYMTATSSENSSQDSLRLSPPPEVKEFDITSPDLSVTNPDLAITSPDLDLTGPDLDLTGPDLDLTGPDLDLTGPDLDLTGPDLDLTSPDLALTIEDIAQEQLNMVDREREGHCNVFVIDVEAPERSEPKVTESIV